MSRSVKLVLSAWVLAIVAGIAWVVVDIGGSAPAIGGPFTLTDHTGKRVTDQDFRGKPTIIYFGFAYCPDVCPTSLLLMQTGVDQLGPQAASKVNLLFITVDPERDPPAALKEYVAQFGPTMVGLTGTPEQIAAVAKAFRVYYQKVPGKDGAPYLVDHSSIFYVMDRNFRFVKHFTHQAKAEDIAAALKPLL
ncbi:MAG: SCO family protein [Alphaproteobacteria bacterium]|nr:SCO family protein [Alphaproteobacteria bacterium]MCW5741641.1 SCO family protein [Alphaproteobacteria bacterium]